MGLDPSVFLHEKALCETDDVGPRTRIWAFAHLTRGAKVGADCNICDHAYIEGNAVIGDRVTIKNNVLVWEGVTVEDDVFLGPNVVFTNDLIPRANEQDRHKPFVPVPTLVKRGASIGANATIVCGTTIGDYAFVGAGAVVVDDVPAHGLILGNPGRRKGWVCKCGNTLRNDLTCPACGRSYKSVGKKRGLVEKVVDPQD